MVENGCNPDCLPVGINRGDAAPTPIGFAEKADHRAVHFGIKNRSGQRRAFGTQLRQDLPQERK